MIDTHCHLLPGLDDGPGSPDEALALARSLVADGIERVVCTPHYSPQFPTAHADAAAKLRALDGELAGLPLDTVLAAEVSPGYAVSAPLDELRSRALRGRYVVCEALPDSPPTFFEAALARLAEAGLAPIFAHPERCRAVQRRIGIVDWARKQGALVQVVAPSLIGRWGGATSATAWRLVDTGRADLLASDAHGTRRRSVHLREAAGIVAERLGAAVAAELTERRPAELLDGAAGR